jgi:hypothetical protein
MLNDKDEKSKEILSEIPSLQASEESLSLPEEEDNETDKGMKHLINLHLNNMDDVTEYLEHY